MNFSFWPFLWFGLPGRLLKKFREIRSIFQAKTPWVDPACADCPGFLVLGAAPAPASTFASDSILLHGALDIWLDLLPAAPLPPVQKRDAQHIFTAQGVTRRFFGPKKWKCITAEKFGSTIVHDCLQVSSFGDKSSP